MEEISNGRGAMGLMFNAKETKDAIVAWIRDWFENNGRGCNAVIGISGGKDSSVVAALLVEALGADRVIGVSMPNYATGSEFEKMNDQKYIDALVELLGIKLFTIPITHAFLEAEDAMITNGIKPSAQAIINLPPRLRMSMLYAVSQSMNGRVANTCNLSEDWVGYSTRYGDSVGDFSPLSRLTTEEVIEVGIECGLPELLVNRIPSDGLCGKSDEDALGFTYSVMNKYIRTGVCESAETKAKIDRMHELNKFKLELMPCFEYNPE